MKTQQRTGRAGWAMAAVCWLLPVAAVGGGMALAPLQGLAGLAAARGIDRGALRRTLIALAPLVLFLLWSGISVAWSPAHRPEQALKNTAICLTGLALIGGLAAAPARDRARVRATLVVALVVLCALLWVEATFNLAINRLDHPPDVDPGILQRNPGKGVSILILMLWAGLGALAQGGRRMALVALALAAAAAWSTTHFGMRSNGYGVWAGAAGFAIGWIAPRAGPALASGLAAFWLLAAPWLTPLLLTSATVASLPMSWQMRASIWAFTRARILDKPLTGWGLDAARTFGEHKLHLGALTFRAIPLHPHSFSMQVWLETGAVGALLLAAAILSGGLAGGRMLGGSRAAAAALTGAIAAATAIWNVSFGAWQEWWMASVVLACAASAAVKR